MEQLEPTNRRKYQNFRTHFCSWNIPKELYRPKRTVNPRSWTSFRTWTIYDRRVSVKEKFTKKKNIIIKKSIKFVLLILITSMYKDYSINKETNGFSSKKGFIGFLQNLASLTYSSPIFMHLSFRLLPNSIGKEFFRLVPKPLLHRFL